MQVTSNEAPANNINHSMQQHEDTQFEERLQLNMASVKQEPAEAYSDLDETNPDWPIRNMDDISNPVHGQYPISDGIFGLVKNEGEVGKSNQKVKGRKSTPKKRQLESKKSVTPVKAAKKEDGNINSEMDFEEDRLINVSQFAGLLNNDVFNEQDNMEELDGLKTENIAENEQVLLQCPHCDFSHTDRMRYRFHLYTKHNDVSAGMPKLHKCDKCDYLSFR